MDVEEISLTTEDHQLRKSERLWTRPTINEPNVSLKYPDIARLRLSPSYLEITDYFGRVQRFRIVWLPTYFGRHRAIGLYPKSVTIRARRPIYSAMLRPALYLSRKLTQPIRTKDGGALRTVLDARTYMMLTTAPLAVPKYSGHGSAGSDRKSELG